MKRKQFLGAALAVMAMSAALLAGCGKAGGDEYLGKWEEVDEHSATLDITKNGDGFLVTMTDTKPNRQGIKESGTNPAVLKDGALNFQNGPVTGTVTHVKNDDTLLVSFIAGTLKFERVK